MAKIRIIKKNNDCSMEYEVGDICEVTGTWYGGVHINGRSGIPVSLDKEEYMELNTEPEEPDSAENENNKVLCEIAPEFELLEHNAIMDTFRQLYREEIGVALK